MIELKVMQTSILVVLVMVGAIKFDPDQEIYPYWLRVAIVIGLCVALGMFIFSCLAVIWIN